MTLSPSKMTDYCTYCPKMCRFSCPVSEVEKDESYTPWGKMNLASLLFNNHVHLSEEVAAASYKCLSCMRCQVYCDHSIDVPASLHQVRKQAIKNYVAPQEVMEYEKKFHQYNNPYEKNLSQIIKETLPGKEYEHPGDVLFWPTCHTVNHFPERLQAYTELFKKLGVKDVSIHVHDMQCCGQGLFDLGFDQEFEEVAEVIFYSLKSYKTLISDGPGCAFTLAATYKERHFPLQAIHLIEYMRPYFKNSNYHVLDFTQRRIAYLDSFYLTRRFEIAELPRQILEEVTGLNLIEFDHHGWDAISAGIGGAFELTSPDSSHKLATNMMKQAEEKGVELLLCSCSQTEAFLNEINPDFPVMDLFEFLNAIILE